MYIKISQEKNKQFLWPLAGVAIFQGSVGEGVGWGVGGGGLRIWGLGFKDYFGIECFWPPWLFEEKKKKKRKEKNTFKIPSLDTQWGECHIVSSSIMATHFVFDF